MLTQGGRTKVRCFKHILRALTHANDGHQLLKQLLQTQQLVFMYEKWLWTTSLSSTEEKNKAKCRLYSKLSGENNTCLVVRWKHPSRWHFPHST